MKCFNEEKKTELDLLYASMSVLIEISTMQIILRQKNQRNKKYRIFVKSDHHQQITNQTLDLGSVTPFSF